MFLLREYRRPLPRRDRGCFAPQPPMLFARPLLQVAQVGRRAARPCPPALHPLLSGIDSGALDLAEDVPVAVDTELVERDGLRIAQLRERVARLRAVRLSDFGRI